jgi:hypothetical protein
MVNNAYQTSSRYLLKKGLTMQSYLLTLFLSARDLEHLFTQCNYFEALWNSIATKYNLPGGPTGWITFILSSGSKKEIGSSWGQR